MIGLKIYKSPSDYNEFINRINILKVDSVFVGDSAASDLSFQSFLKMQGKKIYYIFQTFYNPEYLKNHKESYAVTKNGNIAKDEWVEFVCPTDPLYQSELLTRLENIINKYDPDAISLDFIRQFVFWEKVYGEKSERLIESCNCKRCKSDPRSKYKIITDVVKKLSVKSRELKSDIIVDLHAVPWMKDEYNNAGLKIAGQDLKAISEYVDFITPMCYSHMLKKSPTWINEVVKDHNAQSGIDVIPAIQSRECYLSNPIRQDEYKEILLEALKSPSKGLIIWSWETISDNERFNITKDILERHYP